MSKAKKKQKTIGFERRPVKDTSEEGDVVTNISGSSPPEWYWEHWANGNGAARPEDRR